MLLGVELALDLVEVQLGREVVDLLGLALQVLDVLGRPLDDLVLACVFIDGYPCSWRGSFAGFPGSPRRGGPSFP